MKEWFTAAELAGLVALPRTHSAVIRRSRRDAWQSRKRAASGGGREYHISSLPDATRVALLMRERRMAVVPVVDAPLIDRTARHAELWAAFERKPDRVKAEAHRRLTSLVGVEELIRGGCDRMEAYAIVAHQVGDSESTVRNWWRAVKGEPQSTWAPLLAPKYVGRTKTADYDARIYAMFRDSYLHPSRPPAKTCFNRVARWAAEQELAMPSYATLTRELKRREDPAVVLLEREGERALQAAFPYLERSRAGMYAMQAVNADGHVLDLSVVWPDGEEVRATLLTVQDVYSSAIVGYELVKSESAYGMSLAFLKTFERVGIPKRLFLDNTLAAASKRMTAGAPGRKRFRDREGDAIGVLPALGVQVTFVTPAHGQAKPVERAFRTLADLISKHPAFTGAYLGNSTVTKPSNYGDRTITIAELEPVVRNEIASFNAERGRRTETCQGVRSFQDAFDTSYQEHAHEIARLTASQRRLLYYVAENVTVDRRDGCVKLFKNRYWSEEVSRLRGTKVVLRYDPTESLHKSVLVYRLDGTLVAEAPIYSKAGFSDAAAAERHTRARRQFVRSKKDLAQATRRLEASEVEALVPRVDGPELPVPPVAATRRIDPAIAATVEQLGRVSARDQRAAAARVNDAVSAFADTLIPKRKRA